MSEKTTTSTNGAVKLVTIKDYSLRNQISESTVRRLIRAGVLEHVRFGRVIRIPLDALPTEVPRTPIPARSASQFRERLKKICA